MKSQVWSSKDAFDIRKPTPNGISNHYQLDQSIFILSVPVFSNFIKLLIEPSVRK